MVSFYDLGPWDETFFIYFFVKTSPEFCWNAKRKRGLQQMGKGSCEFTVRTMLFILFHHLRDA